MGTQKQTPQQMGAIPCPFCGSINHLSFGERLNEVAERVECNAKACGTEGPAAKSKKDAVAKWNRYRAMSLCQRLSKINGLIGNNANICKTDPEKADTFIRECEEQAKKLYNKCCESWGKELTDEIIDYAT